MFSDQSSVLTTDYHIQPLKIMTTNPTRSPNVIVFFTDQQRWDTTGVHGNPLGLTPNFDRMAQQGTDVHFAFTPQPVCAPARS